MDEHAEKCEDKARENQVFQPVRVMTKATLTF